MNDDLADLFQQHMALASGGPAPSAGMMMQTAAPQAFSFFSTPELQQQQSLWGAGAGAGDQKNVFLPQMQQVQSSSQQMPQMQVSAPDFNAAYAQQQGGRGGGWTEVKKAPEYGEILSQYGGLRLAKPYVLKKHQHEVVQMVMQRWLQPRWKNLGFMANMEMGTGKTLVAAILMMWNILRRQQMGLQHVPALVVCPASLLMNWLMEMEAYFGGAVRILVFHSDFTNREDMMRLRVNHLNDYDLVVVGYEGLAAGANSTNLLNVPDPDRGLLTFPAAQANDDSEDDRWRSNPYITGWEGWSTILQTEWSSITFDECQMLAEPANLVWKACMSLRGRYRLGLSGTPIVNHELDLYGQFRCLGFHEVLRSRDWNKASYKQFELDYHLVRMTTKQAGLVLPELKLGIVKVQPSAMEIEAYDAMADLSEEAMMAKSSKEKSANMLVYMLRLRQMTIAPYICTLVAKEKAKATGKRQARTAQKQAQSAMSYLTAGGAMSMAVGAGAPSLPPIDEEKKSEHLRKEYILGHYPDAHKDGRMREIERWMHDRKGTAGLLSKKIQAIVQILKTRVGKDEKALIYCNYNPALELIQESIYNALGFIPLYFNGTVSMRQRKEIITRFKHDPGMRALLIPYRCGSTGLNLIMANHIIEVDFCWTDAMHKQTHKRIHRMGQTKPCFVWRLVEEDTIDVQLLERAYKKYKLSQELLGSDEGEGGEGDDLEGNEEKAGDIDTQTAVLNDMFKKRRERLERQRLAGSGAGAGVTTTVGATPGGRMGIGMGGGGFR